MGLLAYLNFTDKAVELFNTENGESIPTELVKIFYNSANKVFDELSHEYEKSQGNKTTETDVKVGDFLYTTYLDSIKDDLEKNYPEIDEKKLRKFADGIFNWR